MLSILLVTTVATAAVLPVAPGRTIQVEQCTSSRRARCWSRAQRLTRFAGESSTQWGPIRTDVRLIWEEHSVLVRVANIPEHQQVELVVFPSGTTDAGKAQFITAGKGVTRHNLGPKPVPGQVRSARLMLRDTRSQQVRSWAPTGPGDLTRPTTLWFSATKQTIPNWSVDSTDNSWSLTSEEPSEITVKHRRPILPAGGKGVSKPWSVSINSGESFPAPVDPGWYDVHLTWGKDNTLRTTSGSLYWEPPNDERVESFGIHPTPKSMTLQDGQPFRLNERIKICSEGEALAAASQFFTSEVQRLTGIHIEQDCSGDSAIRFGLAPQEIRHRDGFTIQSRQNSLNLRANSAAGLMYGAQALADLLGLDGEAESIDIVDWPAIERRILFHELPAKPGQMVDPTVFMEFLRSAVVRGRINTLIIDLKDGYTYKSHPELSRPDAWTLDDVNLLLDLANTLGVEVIPTVNTPGHASWITSRHPDLIEEGTNNLLCTRNPQTRVLIEDLYTELIEAFRQPKFIHIGHDEIRWRTRWKHEIQRCPRCEGTPRWALIEEDLLWNHSVLMPKGVRPMVWSDMLVQGWHGDWDGIYRSSHRIPENIRPDFVIMSWGRNGDTVGTLVPMGYSVVRGSTGHADWKRRGLAPVAQGVAGEAMALFYATPWSSFGGGSGPTNLHHHWSQVVLFGATAWRPDIADTPIYANLGQLRNHPAYVPGLQQWSPKTQFSPLRISGTINDKHDIKLPDSGTVNGVLFSIRSVYGVTSDSPIELPATGLMNGISILQGVQYDRTKETLLIKAHHKTPQMSGLSVGEITAKYTDGTTNTMPVILGQSTERVDRPVPATILWRASGTLNLPSTAAARLSPAAQDRSFYRIDWHNPHPDKQVTEVKLRATHPEVTWLIAAATVAR